MDAAELEQLGEQRSRVVGTWMVNDAAERQVALEGVGGFKNTTSSNIVGVASALKF